MDKKEFYKFLGLKKTEVKIFESLGVFKSIAEISAETKISRMTVHITIKRFLKRNLIVNEKLGKRKVYKQNLQNNFLTNSSLPLNEYENVIIYKGAKELFEIWNKMTKIKNEKIIAYQPNSSIMHSLKKVDFNELIELNNKIRENNNISEAYLDKNFTEIARKLIPDKIYNKWSKSLKRTSIVYEVDRNMFSNINEIFIVRDSVFITNWDKEISVEIKQYEIVNLVKNFFELLKLVSNRVDFNKKLENGL